MRCVLWSITPRERFCHQGESLDSTSNKYQAAFLFLFFPSFFLRFLLPFLPFFFFFDLPSFLQPSSKTFLINWNGIDKVLFRPSYLLIYFISSWAVGFVPKCILTGQFNSFSEMLKFNQLYVKTEGDLIVLSVVYFNYLFLI